MHLRRRDDEQEPDGQQDPGPRPGPIGRLFLWTTRPLRSAWSSDRALDRYALVHFASVVGDTFVVIALADSIFFSVPVGEARLKVALYLALTMAPLAVAGLLLVPLLDRAGPRRIIDFTAAAARVALALLLVNHMTTNLLFPLAFGLLVFTKIHSITKNGLTLAYAGETNLVQANARLARWGVCAAVLASPIAIGMAKVSGSGAAMAGASVAYLFCGLLVLRLPHPRVPKRQTEVTKLGKLPELTVAAAGVAGIRMATGFLIFLLAFSLRGASAPPYWAGVLAGLATVGLYVGDFLAPKLPRRLREEGLVLVSLVAAGIGAVLAYGFFALWVLGLFTFIAGMSSEFGRLALQSLAQKYVPEYAHGRVFVRYEVIFQLSWVIGAFIPALIPIDFRLGILIMGAFYLFVAGMFVLRPMVARRSEAKRGAPFDQEG